MNNEVITITIGPRIPPIPLIKITTSKQISLKLGDPGTLILEIHNNGRTPRLMASSSCPATQPTHPQWSPYFMKTTLALNLINRKWITGSTLQGHRNSQLCSNMGQAAHHRRTWAYLDRTLYIFHPLQSPQQSQVCLLAAKGCSKSVLRTTHNKLPADGFTPFEKTKSSWRWSSQARKI